MIRHIFLPKNKNGGNKDVKKLQEFWTIGAVFKLPHSY